jgi:hypothetical protein
MILIFAAHQAHAQIASQWIPDAQQQEILSRVRAILPAGSAIDQTSSSPTPDNWIALDHRGFEIDGRTGQQHKFQICFVPVDWVGIRMAGAERPLLVYWEGILLGTSYKIITNTEDVGLHQALQQMPAQTPSLINGGVFSARALFKDRIEELDRQTQELVDQFCHDRACRDEAAYSLIVLGIPARRIILDCAEHGTGRAQKYSIAVLGDWRWPDSLRILIGAASDPATPALTQKVVAMSLEAIADFSSGPALTTLLRTTEFSEAASMAAEALGRIRYEEAAPVILSRMEREPDSGRFAQALASLQYKPAIPAIEKMSKHETITSDWVLAEQHQTYLGWLSEVALMRLTADWGPPSAGIRILMLPPGHPVTKESVKTAVVIENVGTTDLDGVPTGSGQVIVDGKIFDEPQMTVINGNITLRVNDVQAREVDLSNLIATSGLHRVQYRFGTAESNTLVLRIP